MTEQELYRRLKQELERIVRIHHLQASPIRLKSRGLSPEEAIGNTVRKDYPILAGKEIMLQAQFGSSLGQAFTDAPSDFCGTLEQVLALEPENDPHGRGLLVAALNAVMRRPPFPGISPAGAGYESTVRGQRKVRHHHRARQ